MLDLRNKFAAAAIKQYDSITCASAHDPGQMMGFGAPQTDAGALDGRVNKESL
jgi:hypothetical protein